MLDIKTIAYKYLKEKKSELIKNGCLDFYIWGIPAEGPPQNFILKMDDENETERIPSFLKDMTLIFEKIIVIADMLVVESNGNIAIQEIENHPDTIQALTCIIYTSNQTYEKKLMYSPDILIFHESNWEIMKKDRSGVFLNPYERNDPFNQIDPVELI